MQSWTLGFSFHVQWAALANWIPWNNLSIMLVVLSSSTCLVVFPKYAVDNLGLTLYSSAGFALKTAFYWKMEYRMIWNELINGEINVAEK